MLSGLKQTGPARDGLCSRFITKCILNIGQLPRKPFRKLGRDSDGTNSQDGMRVTGENLIEMICVGSYTLKNKGALKVSLGQEGTI